MKRPSTGRLQAMSQILGDRLRLRLLRIPDDVDDRDSCPATAEQGPVGRSGRGDSAHMDQDDRSARLGDDEPDARQEAVNFTRRACDPPLREDSDDVTLFRTKLRPITFSFMASYH